ncbi:MAG: MYG1 family protein [Solirubrobacteraceae bacterium]
MRVATHSGGFHADDVFAIAVLRLVHGEALEVVRTRDRDLQQACDLRVDVGGRDDPSTGDFDHHQRGGAGERANGIRYASFGLVWREHGEALAGSEEAAGGVDEFLVQGVDANDTGQTIVETLVGDVRPLSVSAVIAGFNPLWDEDLTSAEEDDRFAAAVAVAEDIVRRSIAGAQAWQRARSLVHAAIERAEDPRVVELERNMPWREPLVASAPEALFVIYPKSDGWALNAVPVDLGSFDNRLDLPEAWAGLTDEQLQAQTGVADALFAHPARFYASARSREGVMALARLALPAT